MNPFATLSKKRLRRREEEVRRFLADARASFNGRPPIPEAEAVSLCVYGTVWKDTSALTVRLVGRRDAATFDPQLCVEPVGPKPESVILSPEHAARVVDLMKEAQRDGLELGAFLSRGSAPIGTGGQAQPTERQLEILRRFGFENLGARVALVGQPAGGR
jgi:hypothetical protein